MEQIRTKVKKWGNSFGIVIPVQIVKEEKIREGDDVDVLINKDKGNVLCETFGTLKFKKSTQEILDESDRKDWDE
jgi:antitoxin component of MazEF toxin-antitoxin module